MLDIPNLNAAAFVTFYSFKGGVGRSMALINVAGIMAGRGFRVLALDMDLEAPGISYLMRNQGNEGNGTQLGFVDLLNDACDRGEQSDLFALSPTEVIEKYSYHYTIPSGIRQSKEGLLRIMPAGRFDGHYQERLDDLGLGQLYRDGQGQPLIEAFKQVILSAGSFDFVFIDSRTGFSDESGICTRDLGDYLAVVMGLNRQNEAGTAEFLRSLRESGSKPKGLRIILSPVPNGEDELVEQREKEVLDSLSKAWGEPLELTLQIPYHPRLALTEEPHIFRRSRGYLYEAYAAIEGAMLSMLGLTTGSLRREILKASKEKRIDLVIHHLKRLEKLDASSSTLSVLIVGELMDLCLSSDAGDLRQYAAATLQADSWATSVLASRLASAKHKDAAIFFERALKDDSNNAEILGEYALFLIGEKDSDGAEALYKRAVAADSTHAHNLGNYALFLKNERKDPDGAEALYKRAIEADPTHAHNLGNYAVFLENERKDPDGAEALYKRAVAADSTHAHNLGNYALFLKNERKDPDGAEALYKRAIEADPTHAHNLGNYAVFLANERKDPDGAEALYKRAVEADPTNAHNLGNYAVFLENERKDPDGAEALYKRAIEADPTSANNLGNYANFLAGERKDPDGAEALYKRAIEADPTHANSLGNYANFLADERKDPDGAEALYKRAIEADPTSANKLGNYAKLLFIRNRLDEAKAILKQAWKSDVVELQLQTELRFYECAHCWQQYPHSVGELKKLLVGGVFSNDWPLDENVRIAHESGHPYPDFIEALAHVVSGQADVKSLETFAVWQTGRF